MLLFATALAANPDASPRRWTGPVSGYEMVRVKPAQFTMGSASDALDRESDEGPVKVEITRPFHIGVYEVTQAQWLAVMGDPFELKTLWWEGEDKGPCTAWGGLPHAAPDNPMSCVAWIDAIRFANEMSERDGLTPAYRIQEGGVVWVRSANGYRLPTEAEWELAARAGSTREYAGTRAAAKVCRYGNVPDATAKASFEEWITFGCSDGWVGSSPVGSYRPNAWGLYDMMGNVWEWTWDWYGADLPGGRDPIGPSTGEWRVTRGGSWYTGTIYALIANRNYVDPANRDVNVGIRLVRSM